MASIRAILKINENGNGVMESVTTNVETNNISTLKYATDLTSWFMNQTSANKNYRGASVNVVGISKYGNEKYGVKQTIDNTYTNSYNGLMFPAPSQLNRNLKITIVGQDILSFNIYFDSSMNQYPTSYSVYSSISQETRTFTNDDFMIEVSGLLAGHGTTEITFLGWNEQNAPIGITYIENVEIEIPMDKYWIDEFETQTQKTSDGEAIQYGVLANTGSVTLRDRNKTLAEYSKMGYLGMYLFELNLFINNRIVQSHISNSAPYFTDNSTMKFELTNDIVKFQNKYYNEGFSSGYNVYEIIGDIFSSYEFDVEYADMLAWTPDGNISIDIGSYLSYFEVPSQESFDIEGSILEVTNKICNAFGLQVYFDDSGSKLIFTSARPRMASNEIIINVPYKKQYSDFDYSILTINRYDRVFFDDEVSYANYKNAVTLSKNEFFNLDNVYRPTGTVEESLRQSILEDYADGIRIAKISVFPSDLYTTTGVLVKKWNRGQILGVNDIIRVENKDGDNVLYDKNYNEVYWRIIDRKVKYEGQILIDLIIQEIKN